MKNPAEAGASYILTVQISTGEEVDVIRVAGQIKPVSMSIMDAKNTYRRDIDGLRAIAVVLVVLYHYGVGPFTGGYIGVDVFFVISGYVITAKVRRDRDAGTFTLRRFYAGRIRRIVPALATVIFTSLIAGWFLLMPSDYAALGDQSAYAALGLSNFYFFNNSGYFSRASDLLPLLHTWSLAIEEQFYLLWPTLLVLITLKLTHKAQVLAIAALIAVSLILSIVTVSGDQLAAFYLLQSRAWELALGGLLTYVPALRRPALANMAGLFLIVLSAVTLKEHSTFPGAFAIPVCLGTALLVWPKSRPDPISRILSSSPAVMAGLLSYSLYLWHWPILVFYRHINFEQDPTLAMSAALIVLSVLAAFLSLHLIENPIRYKASSRKLSFFLPTGAVVILAFVAAGVSAASGMPQRIPEAALSVAEGTADISHHRTACHRPTALAEAPIGESCHLGAPSVAPSSIIWGDSHAVELGDALSEQLAHEGKSLLSVTYSSCPPAVGFERAIMPGCDEHNAAVLDYILSNPRLDTVFLVARYEGVLSEDASGFVGALRATVQNLVNSGRNVVLFSPVPSNNGSIPVAASRMMMYDENNVLTISFESYREKNRAVLDLLDKLEKTPGVYVIRLAQLLCDDTSCRTVASGRSLYFDRHHPSMFGAKMIVEGVWPQIARFSRTPSSGAITP